MTTLQVIILGIIQGLTEFLPISSSAHLVLLPYLLKWNFPPVALDAALHFGTFLALLVYFFPEVLKILRGFFLSFQPSRKPSSEEKFYLRLSWWIIIGTIPIVIIALLFKNQVESSFKSALITSVFLLLTGVLLAFADTFSYPTKPMASLNPLKAFFIGIFQAFAVFPGISRSGATISGGLIFGLRREEAARFSFLLSLPAVIGATVLEIPSLNWEGLVLGQFLIGIGVSTLVGILCIHYFLKFLRRSRLIWFAIYCWLFGLFALLKIFVF
jgi:undecaprenyl-diphosphatase